MLFINVYRQREEGVDSFNVAIAQKVYHIRLIANGNVIIMVEVTYSDVLPLLEIFSHSNPHAPRQLCTIEGFSRPRRTSLNLFHIVWKFQTTYFLTRVYIKRQLLLSCYHLSFILFISSFYFYLWTYTYFSGKSF